MKSPFSPLRTWLRTSASNPLPEGVGRGRERQPHGDLGRQPAVERRVIDGRLVPQFEVPGVQFVGEADGPVDEQRLHLGRLGDDAVSVEVRQADEEAAEQGIAHERQGQVPAHLAADGGLDGVSVVVEAVARDGEPVGVLGERAGPHGLREGGQGGNAAGQTGTGQDRNQRRRGVGRLPNHRTLPRSGHRPGSL